MKVLDELSRKINLITKQFLILLLYLGLAITLSALFNKLLTSTNFYIANLSYLLIDLITLIIFLFVLEKLLFRILVILKKIGENILINILYIGLLVLLLW